MSVFGFFTLAGTGHLNPAAALGRRLRSRGHEITFFQSPVARALIRTAGLNFVALGSDRETAIDDRLPELETRQPPIFSRVLETHAIRVLRHGPAALANSNVNALIVDQADLAAGTVAELLNLPFVYVCLIPPIDLDNSIPPFNFWWRHRVGCLWRLRNRIGNMFAERIYSRALARVNEQRRLWQMPAFHHVNDVFSNRSLVAQIPAAFDFQSSYPQKRPFYTGPFYDGQDRPSIVFPWHRLNGKPIIYASMGTVRNDAADVFRTIASACHGIEGQLVVSLGGGRLTPESVGSLAGDPIVVHFAPQLELMRRAHLVITHAGLNTVLESLSNGVPMVAIPVTDDQPGIAARIEFSGAGTAIPIRKLSVGGLRTAITQVLDRAQYRVSARKMQAKFTGTNGLECACMIIESLLK